MKFSEYLIDDQREIYRSFYGMFIINLMDIGAIEKFGFDHIKKVVTDLIQSNYEQRPELISSFLQSFLINEEKYPFSDEVDDEINGYIENLSSDEIFNIIEPGKVELIIGEEDWSSYIYFLSEIEIKLRDA